MYFWLHWVFLAVYGLSLVALKRGYSPVAMHGASHCGGFCCCRAQSLGCVGFSSCWHMSAVAPWHMESFRTMDGTYVPCIGRLILKHETTGKPQTFYIFFLNEG